MPQISQIAEIYASQAFWLVLFFGAILVFVGYGMLPKIQSTVDARDARIAADLKEAETARNAADGLEEGYRGAMDEARAQAAKLAAHAKAEAAKASEQRVAEADKAIAGKIDAAAAKVAEARRAALAELEAVAAEATQDIVARVAGVTVDSAAAKAAVAKEMAHG